MKTPEKLRIFMEEHYPGKMDSIKEKEITMLLEGVDPEKARLETTKKETE